MLCALTIIAAVLFSISLRGSLRAGDLGEGVKGRNKAKHPQAYAGVF